MNKTQQAFIIKAFRLIREGAAEGERIARDESAEAVAKHVDDMIAMLAVVKEGIGHHIGAQAVLKGIGEVRPKVAAKIGRPKLSLVK